MSTETPAAEAAENPSIISVRQLMECGVHYGHQTRRWNPKMKPYIYGSRDGVHIINLMQTQYLFRDAYNFISRTVARGGHVLFVGTKPQAREVIAEEALRARNFFAVNRWLGGMLTNWETIKKSIERLHEHERMAEDGTIDRLPKKEVLRRTKEQAKLEASLGGIKHMKGLPSAMFVVDPRREKIAVAEARKLRIPVIAITDTNCDPDLIDYVIPGNDDAIRSIRLFAERIADACLNGAKGSRKQGNDGDSLVPSAADTDLPVVVQKKPGAPPAAENA